MISYIDTEAVTEIADELASATTDLEIEINALFKRLEKVPAVSMEWIGNQSDYYFSRVALEKPTYDNFILELRNFASELNYEASNAYMHIKSNNLEG